MLGFLTNVRLLYVLVPLGVVAAAVSVPNLDLLSVNKGCVESEERTCYDKGTKNNVKIFKGKAGGNAFAACMSNPADNVTGTLTMATNVCGAEVVNYCFEGASDNFIRQFEGNCEYEIPDLSVINISGRFVDGVTGESVANVRVWDPEVGMNTSLDVSDSAGKFAFETDTTSVTETAESSTGYSTGRCYFENWGLTSILRNADDTLRLRATQFDFKPGDLVINPLTSPDIDLGDVPLWPATGLSFSADIPVKLYIPYPEEDKSLGNTLLRTDHKLSNAIPLEQPVSVRLVDKDGVEYVSPEKTYPLSKGCSTVTLNFRDGEFSWSE